MNVWEALSSAIQSLRAPWLALFAGLARDTGMHVLAGSFLLEHGAGRYRNRSDLFAPDGGHLWQDKLQLTGFEKATGVIDGGDALKVATVAGVRAGISICYDSEFPLPVRAQYEAGARLLLVPSCTDTAAGGPQGHRTAHWGPERIAGQGQACAGQATDQGTLGDVTGVVTEQGATDHTEAGPCSATVSTTSCPKSTGAPSRLFENSVTGWPPLTRTAAYTSGFICSSDDLSASVSAWASRLALMPVVAL